MLNSLTVSNYHAFAYIENNLLYINNIIDNIIHYEYENEIYVSNVKILFVDIKLLFENIYWKYLTIEIDDNEYIYINVINNVLFISKYKANDSIFYIYGNKLCKVDKKNIIFNNQNIVNDNIELDKNCWINFDNFSLYKDNNLINIIQNNGVALQIKNLTYAINNKIMLKNINLDVCSNSLCAIIGNSGTGKSTLLNLLAGNKFKNNIFYYIDNNVVAYDNNIIIVPQEVCLFENLTCFENLYFTAKMIYNKMSKQEICKLIDNYLYILEILHLKNIIIGTKENKILSGGEKKKINIAKALIKNPHILLLDEPLSGLSSQDSLDMMHLLKRLSQKKCSVIFSLHQPSEIIYNLLDEIIVLCKNTNNYTSVSYAGVAHNTALLFFNYLKYNIKDILYLQKQENDYFWQQKYENIIKNKNKNIFFNRTQNNNKLYNMQISILLKRELIIKIREYKELIWQITQLIISLVFLLLAYNNKFFVKDTKDIINFLFIYELILFWNGCTFALKSIISESSIIKYDTTFGLNLVDYIITKILFGILYMFFLSFLIALTFNIFQLSYINLLYINFLILIIGYFCGMIISILTPKINIAVSTVPFIIIPNILFADIIFSLSNRYFLIFFLSDFMPSKFFTIYLLNLYNDIYRIDNFERIMFLLFNTNKTDNTIFLIFIIFLLLGIFLCYFAKTKIRQVFY